jgi:hypothetical protein
MMIMTSPPPPPISVGRFKTGGHTGMMRCKTKSSSVDTFSFGATVERVALRPRGAQPISPRTEALIDIQTYEGSFELDSTLAALLGVSMPDLEAKLATFAMLSGGSLSEEQKRKVWATVFAIKVFETQLAGERDVWELVVDKAWAWVRTVMRDGDVKALEREVLGL